MKWGFLMLRIKEKQLSLGCIAYENIPALLERTKQAGLKPTEIYGDKAYFRKNILETIKENEAEAYIPISASAYRIDEERFSYNKDSDQWFCNYGNCTEKKVTKKERTSLTLWPICLARSNA